jgi:hypothetical protein
MRQSCFAMTFTVLASALLLAAAVPGQAADYHIYGWVYAANPLPEDAEAPPAPITIQPQQGAAPTATRSR